MKFDFNQPNGFSGKKVWKCWIWVTLDQGQWMTLTFDVHIDSCSHLDNCIYQLWHHRLYCTIVSETSIVLPFSHTKKKGDQIWPCRKIGHGQPRVIIWTHLVVLEHPMLHANFQGHMPFVSGEEDFLKFLLYMGMAAILVMWPGLFEQTFVPLSHGGSIWNLTLIGTAVSEGKMFKACGRRRDRRTDDARRRPTYHISSPVSLRFRCAKRCDKPTNKWMKKPKAICPTNFFKCGHITMTQIKQSMYQE